MSKSQLPPIKPLKRYSAHPYGLDENENGPLVKHADVEEFGLQLSTFVLEQARQMLQRNSQAALYVASTQGTRKRKGERDTEFIKRIATKMFDICLQFEREDADALAKGEDIFSAESVTRRAKRMDPDAI